MNIYLTTGTSDFMESLQKRFDQDQMIIMYGSPNTVLMHETDGKTRFQTPRQYAVIASFGALQKEGFFAFNHIPVTDDGKPIYEHRLQNRADSISAEPGLVAFRFLRPKASDTYVVFTQWTDRKAFERWKKSPNYAYLHVEDESGAGLHKGPHIFNSAPYLATYVSKEEDE